MKYNSRKGEGRDYTRPVAEFLPDLIGTRSKTVRTIARQSGRNYETVRKIIVRLHKNGVVFIRRWKRGISGKPAACYQMTSNEVRSEDAPYPAPMTDNEKSRRYRNTAHGKVVIAAGIKRREANRKGVKSAIAYVDPLLAALMSM